MGEYFVNVSPSLLYLLSMGAFQSYQKNHDFLANTQLKYTVSFWFLQQKKILWQNWKYSKMPWRCIQLQKKKNNNCLYVYVDFFNKIIISAVHGVEWFVTKSIFLMIIWQNPSNRYSKILINLLATWLSFKKCFTGFICFLFTKPIFLKGESNQYSHLA